MKRIVVFLVCSLLLLASCQDDVEEDYYSNVDDSFKPIADPSKFDYCTQHCDKNAKFVDDGSGLNPACFCWPEPPRSIILDGNITGIIELRKITLEHHNYLRNQIALGEEERPANDSIPTAANMELLNYDLELEYIARCRAINSYGSTFAKGTSHEPCRKMHDGRRFGQNLALTSHYTADSKWITGRIDRWYEEVRFLANSKIIDKFGPVPDATGQVGHFAALIWATNSRMGCVIHCHPDSARTRLRDNLSYTLMCNYASDHDIQGPNTLTERIFQRGDPCSKCPKGKKCNSKYKALCGELLPVPTDEPFPFMKAEAVNWCRWCYSQFAVLLMVGYFAVHRLLG